MARKYDWKRRTELLVQEIGRFLAYKMANDGATRASLEVTIRGTRMVLVWQKRKGKEFTNVYIHSARTPAWMTLCHNDHLSIDKMTVHKDDYKKLYKQIERTLYTHLVEEWSVEILSDADNNYHWGNTCTKN